MRLTFSYLVGEGRQCHICRLNAAAKLRKCSVLKTWWSVNEADDINIAWLYIATLYSCAMKLESMPTGIAFALPEYENLPYRGEAAESNG